LLLLTTTGAKSGQPRVSPLVYLRIDGKMLILGSFHGADFHPGWVHNLRANRRARVEVGAESFDVTAHELSAGEREQMLPKVTAAVPVFAESQAKTQARDPAFRAAAAVVSFQTDRASDLQLSCPHIFTNL
jgi:deazaflavin-dependent oxidoreductase (nitroreductase family)